MLIGSDLQGTSLWYRQQPTHQHKQTNRPNDFVHICKYEYFLSISTSRLHVLVISKIVPRSQPNLCWSRVIQQKGLFSFISRQRGSELGCWQRRGFPAILFSLQVSSGFYGQYSSYPQLESPPGWGEQIYTSKLWSILYNNFLSARVC